MPTDRTLWIFGDGSTHCSSSGVQWCASACTVVWLFSATDSDGDCPPHQGHVDVALRAGVA